MATLAGSTIASTYTYLLKMDGTSGLTSSLVAVQDGDATDSALKISTTSASVAHTVTTAASTPKALFIDANTSGVAAQNATGMHIDFDRTVAGSGTAAHNDIGIDLDVNSASLGTSSLIGMDIDVVGATSGTSTATGLTVTVGSADTNYAALFSGGNVGIGIAAPDKLLHVYTSDAGAFTPHANADDVLIENGTDVGITLATGNSGSAGIGFEAPSSSSGQNSITWQYNSGSEKLRCIVDSSEVMTMFGASVGIKQTSPSSPASSNAFLHIGSSSLADASLVLEDDNNKWEILSNDSLHFRDGTTNRIVINSSGYVGIGDSSPDAQLDVENLTLDSGTHYTNIVSNVKKTLGGSNASHAFVGIHQNFEWDDDDASSLNSFFDSVHGIRSDVTVTDSDGESVQLIGIGTNNTLTVGDVNVMYGIKNNITMAGGTVDSVINGMVTDIDINGGTLADNVMGQRIDINTTVTPAAQVFGHRVSLAGAGMDNSSGTDRFMLYYDAQNSDTVAQITALAGAATFDSGNFSGAGDYAEYLESKDGNAIAVGTTVKLDGDKVVACSEGDTPIGVVRPDGVGTSAYKAGCEILRWQGKYLYSDYDELQMEDYEIVEWTEEITFDEYIARGKDETGGVHGGNVRDKKVEGSKAIPAKEAVTKQKIVDEEVEKEVTTISLVDGKYVQKTETVTETVKVPQYNEVDLYDEDGEVIGKHSVPIMETVEAVAGVDAVPDTYFRKHSYHSDIIPDGVTAPDDAIIFSDQKRKKLNPDYDSSLHDSYKPRPERDEWNLIGLLGQIPITKGQPLSDNWTKMKDVSDTVEMYFVK